MRSLLLLAAPFLLQAAPPAAPPAAGTVTLPPIKMGLWDATVTTGMGNTLKTRTCMTTQTFRDDIAHMPQGCTLSNLQSSPTSMSGDVKCSLSGATSSGHIDAHFPDASTVHSTINVTTTMQGHSVPVTITTDSHFVSADCGDLLPGQSKVVD